MVYAYNAKTWEVWSRAFKLMARQMGKLVRPCLKNKTETERKQQTHAWLKIHAYNFFYASRAYVVQSHAFSPHKTQNSTGFHDRFRILKSPKLKKQKQKKKFFPSSVTKLELKWF